MYVNQATGLASWEWQLDQEALCPRPRGHLQCWGKEELGQEPSQQLEFGGAGKLF